MNAQVTVETINPKTAKEWLENKLEEQRHMRQNHIARLTTEIENGTFRLTSDAIVLVRGRLANGQHRLSAVIEAGKSAQFIVMRTNDDELYKVIDCGATRSTADVLGNVPYSKAIASAARLVIVYDFGLISGAGDDVSRGRIVLTRSQILKYIEQHQAELSEQASFVYALYGKSRILGTTIGTAFFHIASRKHRAQAEQFITNVYNGETIDATKDFRDRMIRQLGTKSRLRQSYVFALLIKSWRSFKNGTRPGALKMANGEVFPEI